MKEPKGSSWLVITSSGDWLVCVTGLGMLTTFLTKYLYAAAQSVGWQHTDSFPLISDDNSSPPQWEKVSDINSWLFMEWNLSDKSRKEMSGSQSDGGFAIQKDAWEMSIGEEEFEDCSLVDSSSLRGEINFICHLILQKSLHIMQNKVFWMLRTRKRSRRI